MTFKTTPFTTASAEYASLRSESAFGNTAGVRTIPFPPVPTQPSSNGYPTRLSSPHPKTITTTNDRLPEGSQRCYGSVAGRRFPGSGFENGRRLDSRQKGKFSYHGLPDLPECLREGNRTSPAMSVFPIHVAPDPFALSGKWRS